jgi:hypothetical protein
MKHTAFLLITALFLVLGSSDVYADRLAERGKPKKDSTKAVRERTKFHFGAKVGIVGAGGASVEEYDVDLSSGASWGLFVDLPSRSGTCGAFSVDWHKIKPENVDDSRYLTDFSLNLKLALRGKTRSIRLQPGLGIGYGRVSAGDGIPSAGFFVVKGYLDAVCPIGESGTAVLVELGLIAAPYGRSTSGNEYDVSADPRFLLRLGVRL